MLSGWKVILRRVLVLLVMLASVAVVVDQASKQINKYNENELQRNIHSVMDQTADTVLLLLDKHKTFVSEMASRVSVYHDNPRQVQDFVMRQNAIRDSYGFLRVGFIYPDGTAFASDGNTGNLAIRDYFQRSMNGEMVITGFMQSYLGNVHYSVNVVSAPVRNAKGEIVGVVFETIPNSLFNDIMNRGVFAEFGNSALIDNNGDIIASNSSSSFLNTSNDLLVFVTLEPQQKRLSVWQERLKNQSNTTTMYFERNGGQYLHFAPIDIPGFKDPFHIAVLLDSSTIAAQTSHFTHDIYNIMGIILLISAVSAAYYLIDIQHTERKRRKELEQLAYYSSITHGPNMALLEKKLSKSKRSGYVAYMDLREFGVIRSSCGIAKADDLLLKIWHIIEKELGLSELSAHIADDYFGIFFNTTNVVLIEQRLKAINNKLAVLSDLEDVPPLVGFYGLCSYNAGDNIEEAFNHASIARQSIQNKQDIIFAVYDAESTRQYLTHVAFEKSFEKNLHDKKFEVWYQPKFDSFTNEIIGAEALIRLRDKNDKIVPPSSFIPVYEQDGLIRTLDEYVFKAVCQLQKQRQEQGLKLIPISVNLSRASLYYRNIVHQYVHIAQTIGLDPALVPLEITETAAVNNPGISSLMHEFCAHGFKLHLDDFGSGYSSLSALNELPFCNIKIDKSLIDFIGQPNGNHMLKHVIALSKELGMSITAEGVETQKQIDFLKSHDCHCVQGYFFSKPLALPNFLTLLEQSL